MCMCLCGGSERGGGGREGGMVREKKEHCDVRARTHTDQ